MTDHPCKGMTQVQIDAFERLCVNQLPLCGWSSINALMNAGVVKRGQDDLRHDAMGVYNVPTFFVPVPVHMQWCQWCSEQPENKIDAS